MLSSRDTRNYDSFQDNKGLHDLREELQHTSVKSLYNMFLLIIPSLPNKRAEKTRKIRGLLLDRAHCALMRYKSNVATSEEYEIELNEILSDGWWVIRRLRLECW